MADEIHKYSYADVLKTMKYNLRTGSINHEVCLRLDQLALTKIAIRLWEQELIKVKDQNTWCQTLIKLKERLSEKFPIFRKNIDDYISHLILQFPFIECLQKMIQLIENELKKFFIYQEHLQYATWNEIKIYLQNICWNQQGTINYLKTALQLIDHANLSIKEKYIIACNNCLEDKIRDLMDQLPQDFIYDLSFFKKYTNELYFSKDIDSSFIDVKRDDVDVRLCANMKLGLVLFWTFYIKGKTEEFTWHIKGAEVYDFILKWAIYNRKEVAVQYIWEVYANYVMKRRLLEYAKFTVTRSGYDNILLYFLTQMSSVQMEEVYTSMSGNLLSTFGHLSRWCDICIPADLYVLELIQPMKFWDAVKRIAYCYNKNILTIKQCEKLCVVFALNFDLNNDKKFKEFCQQYAKDRFLLKSSYIPVMKLLFKYGSQEVKKEFIISEVGLDCCDFFLIQETLDIFDMFITEMLSTEAEILECKQLLIDQKFDKVCFELIQDNKYNSIQNIVENFFAQDERSKFKKELAYKNEAKFIYNILNHVKRDKILFTINEFLNFCFENDENEIANCKAIIFNIENDFYEDHKKMYFNNVNYLISANQMDIVIPYWRWILFADKNEFSFVAKNDFSSKQNIEKILFHVLNIVSLCTAKESGELIEDFVETSFKSDKIRDMIKVHLRGTTFLAEMAYNMARFSKYATFKSLLNWCYSGEEDEIYLYKVSFMEIHGCLILFELIKYRFEFEKVLNVLKQFMLKEKPAERLIASFEQYLENKKTLKLKELESNGEAADEWENSWFHLMKRANRCKMLLLALAEDENKPEPVVLTMEDIIFSLQEAGAVPISRRPPILIRSKTINPSSAIPAPNKRPNGNAINDVPIPNKLLKGDSDNGISFPIRISNVDADNVIPIAKGKVSTY